ncbi:hypothetical protein GCM10011487_70250 [Steroidobacter agaridevorans]|uniref:Uncharacterized protein n=1 Tax=Steroidobacter agaridevorans TaxID=2695856 RepID=A0A829YNZ3_9GAMM|nr:hypothetical protein GCM10011487_70250 [Steroidobacter agaridevorans]GFE86895.1 hypothetical protein GCM10011488_18490 [Steroidobacter agaridevorans]
MSRAIIKVVEGALSRRRFLYSIATASGALLAGIMGTARAGGSCTVIGCCCLCETGPYNPANCVCEWSWWCCYASNLYACYECFGPSHTCCTKDCTGVIASKIVHISPVNPQVCPEFESCLGCDMCG